MGQRMNNRISFNFIRNALMMSLGIIALTILLGIDMAEGQNIQRYQGEHRSRQIDKLLKESMQFVVPYEVSRDMWSETWTIDSSSKHVIILYSVWDDTTADRRLVDSTGEQDSARVAKVITVYMIGLQNAIQRFIRSYKDTTEFEYFAIEIGWASGYKRFNFHILEFGYYRNCQCTFETWDDVMAFNNIIFIGQTN